LIIESLFFHVELLLALPHNLFKAHDLVATGITGYALGTWIQRYIQIHSHHIEISLAS
ncbi:hypothetical protein ACJX0J_022745, partial [Zea mays]